MKQLTVVILAALAVMAVVTGCGPRYDSRLVQADRLMMDEPDSALTLLEGIADAPLPSGRDSAYRDLLLTQARYRCYIPATSDSAVNRALAYYRAHPEEREKLTRAHIYKGAVMEELDRPDSAMFYYKSAEAVAAPDDYFNLGYVNLRMGALYRDRFSMDGYDIRKYEEAYKCFKHTNEKHYQLVCGIDLASLYRLNHPLKAQELLLESMPLADLLNDTTNYVVCLKSLMGLYYYHGLYDKGRELSQVMFKNYSGFMDYESCFNASKIYALSGMPDSARFFMNLAGTGNDCDIVREMSYLECLSELALAEKDTLKHLKLEDRLKRISDSLMVNKEKHQILLTEHEFEKAAKEQIQIEHNRKSLLLMGLAIFVFLLAAAILYRNKHRNDALIKDLKAEVQNHISDINTLRHNIDQLKIHDTQLKDFISSHIDMMRNLTEACYHSPKNRLSNEISQILSLQKKNKDNWVRLYPYIDIEYNHIMTDTADKYKQLNDNDLLLVALTCLGYSCAQIAIITGYSNATSISGNRQRLAKKMGLDCSLQDYVDQYKS